MAAVDLDPPLATRAPTERTPHEDNFLEDRTTMKFSIALLGHGRGMCGGTGRLGQFL
jgi:hypothetical protein